jgi:hypothetical protein
MWSSVEASRLSPWHRIANGQGGLAAGPKKPNRRFIQIKPMNMKTGEWYVHAAFSSPRIAA